LRISECLNLRLQDFNLDVGRVTVHRGKGKKDRTLPLPQSIMAGIQTQFERVADLHNEDLSMGYAGVFLPDNIEKKYNNAARELSWQWFFPAKTLTFVDNENAYRRYHLHDSHLQKAIKRAVKKAKLTKRVSAHTFRHSFASHLVQAHYDIRTVQELMGHSDVKTTMVYLQTAPSLTLKEAKSPLDFEIY
jgi:integrase